MSSQIFLLSSSVIDTSMQAQAVKQHIRSLEKKRNYKTATLSRMEKKKIVLETELSLIATEVSLQLNKLNHYYEVRNEETK